MKIFKPKTKQPELIPGNVYKNLFNELFIAVRIAENKFRLCSLSNGNRFSDDKPFGNDSWIDVTDKYIVKEIA